MGFKRKPEITKTILQRVMLLLGFSILLFAVIDGYYLHMEFNRQADSERLSYIDSQKKRLKDDVDAALSLIRLEQSELENDLMHQLRDEVYNAHAIASSLYEKYRDRMNHEDIQKVIIESIRPVRFNNGRGYFFVTRLDGVELLFADRPEIEGKQLINMRSSDGKMVIEDMIKIARSGPGEGVYRYSWTKPFEKGDYHQKIAFIKKFEPLNCFIGTGEYISDFEYTRQQEVLRILSAISRKEAGYYFAGQWNGLSLLGPAKGKNMWDTADSDGKKVVQQLVASARSGGGYVEYRMPRQTGYPAVRKISYTLPVPEWKWYVGAGLFVDSIDKVIDEQRRIYLMKQMRIHVVNMGIFLIVALTVWIYTRRLSSAVNTDIENLNRYFMDNASYAVASVKPACPELVFAELDRIGKYAGDMMTELDQAGEKLRIAERTKAIGELAGGIAHDFNNQLGGILGFAELMRNEVGNNPKLSRYTSAIITSAQRSADLTSKLLAFSRKGKYVMKVLDLNQLIAEVAAILSHTINRNIEVVTQLSDVPVYVTGDAAQLQNALLNLGLNARDSMPGGGTLLFRSEKLFLTESETANLQNKIHPGVYNKITVTDTGTGISKDILPHIFEPLYTTKEAGKGTGLGLAAVDGTVRGHNGYISVESIEGSGTSFIIFFPAAEFTGETDYNPEASIGVESFSGLKIVIVDDEENLLLSGSSILTELGAEVFCFGNGIDAIEFLKKGYPVNCMILDMIMPQMGGSEVFVEVRKLRPGLPVLVTSGYSNDNEVRELLKERAVLFLQKPVQMKDLVDTLKSLMGMCS